MSEEATSVDEVIQLNDNYFEGQEVDPIHSSQVISQHTCNVKECGICMPGHYNEIKPFCSYRMDYTLFLYAPLTTF